MLTLLSEMGRSFLRAFLGYLVVLLPGLFLAPDMNAALAFAVSSLIAAFAAGLKAIQVFVPQLTITPYLPARLRLVGRLADSFLRAFIGGLITFALGVAFAPDFHFTKALAIAALGAAFTAAVRAVQGALTQGSPPNEDAGLNPASPRGEMWGS